MLAFPEMEVSGVRRSWEIERSRLARSCSFLARTAAASFSDAYDPVYLFCGPDGQICAARIRKRLRPGARPLVVGQNPLGRLMLRCGGVFAFGKRIINRKDLRRVQLSLI